ncbi:MAG: GMC family oxidoreductase [Euryarchaeota archaeon]|nr:GMC family oxidoreductase [Euryarchaeota archaeon]MDE2043639.1 GMC family oxidoreductase [Thermoplasmata archaeon]
MTPAAVPPPRSSSTSPVSPRVRATLEAVARGLVPSGGSFRPGALELGVPDLIVDMDSEMDRVSRLVVRSLLNLLEIAPVFRGPGRPLSRLRQEEAEEFLRVANSQGTNRPMATWLLRLLVEANYVSTPQVREHLGVREEPMYSVPPVPPPRPPLPTTTFPQLAIGSELDSDVCVVGSGAGGAPAAALLAEAGWKVAVLEEGPAVSRADFQGSAIGRIGRYYRSNGIFFTLGKPLVQISYASSVGGTTVFNSGTCFQPPDSTLDRWAKDSAIPGLTPGELAPYFARVKKFLQVGPSRADILGHNGEMLQKGAQAMGGLKHGIIPRPAPGCRGSDECVIGCPTDAKRSMALSYLPRAVAAGAKVYSRVRVERVRPGPGGPHRWRVEGHVLDPATQRPVGRVAVRCRHAVLAGGALSSPYLLPEVGPRPARSHRGRHLRVHPSLDIGGDFPGRVEGWRGVLQSYYVDDYEHGVLLEATFHPRGLLSTSGLTPFTGARYKEFLERLPHLALIGALIMDESEGHLGPFLAGRPWIRYDMVPADLAKVGRAIALSGRLLFAAGAERVFVPVHGGQEVRRPEDLDRFETSPPGPEALHLLAFHPLGTARMGGAPELGAVDPTGTVWGAPGLHISDASILPGSPSVNPQISIMTLAERNAESWIKQGVGA